MLGFKSYIKEGAKSEVSLYIDELNQIFATSGIVFKRTKKAGQIAHIRANLGSEPKKFMKDYGVVLKDSKEELSGQYDTYVFTNGILFVNQHIISSSKGNNLFITKELTPENFGLAGQTFTQNQIIASVKKHLMANQKYSDGTKEELLELCVKSKDRSKSIKLDDSKFSNTDLKTVSKDFGEILSGIWAIGNMDFNKIYFPALINEPFVDIYGKNGKITVPISVKSGGGSNTTVKNLGKSLDNLNRDTLPPKNKKLYDVIMGIKNSAVMEGILESHKILNTDGYKKLVSILKIKNPTVKQIVGLLDGMERDEIKAKFTPLYKVLQTSVRDNQWAKANKIGFIIGPMGRSLVNTLNNATNKKLLTDIAKHIQIIQLNVDVKTKTLNFKVKSFKDATFKFGWGGGVGNPNRNSIGFKME